MKSFIILFLTLGFSSAAFSYSAQRSFLDSKFTTAEIGERPHSNRGMTTNLPNELIGWTDPLALSTVKLSNQCGVLFEAQLVGDSKTNFLFIGIVNESNKDLRLKRNEILAVFSGGRERVLIESSDKSYEEIKSKQYGWGFASFPSKVDFKNQDSVKVIIPLESGGNTLCKLETVFERNKNIDAGMQDSTSAPVAVWSLGYTVSAGMTPAAATTFNNFNPNGGMFAIQFFRDIHSGIFVNVDVQNLGDVYPSEYYNSKKYRKVNLAAVSVGRAWRAIYSDIFAGYSNFGLSGAMTLPETRDTNIEGDPRLSPGLYASYTFEWIYSKGTSVKDADNSFGLTLFAKYYPWLFDGDRPDYGTVGISFDFLRGGK